MLRDGWRLKPQLVETHKRSSRRRGPVADSLTDFLDGSIQ
jgi:hypothetical protein